MRVLSKLKVRSNYYNYNQPTAIDFFRDVSNDGLKAALDKRRMWNQMRMSPTDLADLSGATLTYLTNGLTPAGNWTGQFRPGERVRLRFINGAGNTFFDVRIPGLKLRVVQVDGINIEPVTVDEFRFGPGETCDVVVEPRDEAYTIFSQSMDRTGYARGTLSVRDGVQAPVPALDKAEWLTMGDMMGDMAGMQHGGMNHGAMAMDHSQHAMDHSQHAMHGAEAGNPLRVPNKTVRHARTEYGASTDMRVDTPRTNLDDPGIGLRNNGRRVLTLADMHTLGGPPDPRGRARDRTAPYRQHGALHVVVRWRRVRQIDTRAFPLRRTPARHPSQRHDDDPSHAYARHVERPRGARRHLPGAPHTIRCSPHSASASLSPPMRWAAGPGIAT